MSESSGNFDAESVEPASKELVKTEEADITSASQPQEKGEPDSVPQSKKPAPKNAQSTKSALVTALKTSNLPQTRSELMQNDSDQSTVMIKYSFFWVSSKENEKIYNVNIEFPHLETVLEAIRDIIPYFNQKLAEEGAQYTLSLDANLYDLYKSKKTGHAKTDYPALDSSQILNQVGILTITVVEKNDNAIISKNPSSATKKITKTDINVPVDPPGRNKASMVDPSVIQQKINTIGYEDVIVTEYVCFCFPKKRIERRKKESISLTSTDKSLNQQLLDK